jgi:hypothetical protein
MTAQTVPIRTTPYPLEARRIDGFRRLTTAAVLLLAAPLTLFQALVMRQLDPFVSGFIAVSLLLGALSALRFRWAPLPGVLWGAALALLVTSISTETLTRPGGGGMEFAVVASLAFLGAVAAACGVVATMRGYRGATGLVPGWFRAGVLATAGALVGAIFV